MHACLYVCIFWIYIHVYVHVCISVHACVMSKKSYVYSVCVCVWYICSVLSREWWWRRRAGGRLLAQRESPDVGLLSWQAWAPLGVCVPTTTSFALQQPLLRSGYGVWAKRRERHFGLWKMVKIKKGRKSRVVELREPERKTESGVLTVFTEAFQHPDGYVCLFSTFSYPGGVGKGRLCYVPLFNPS